MNRKLRLWLERVGIGFIAFLSLSAPFVFGFVYYLGVSDGIEISPDDPLHVSRVWMIRERTGPIGIGWLRTEPVAAPEAHLQCARSELLVLNWQGGLSLSTDARYCKCYELNAKGGIQESTRACP